MSYRHIARTEEELALIKGLVGLIEQRSWEGSKGLRVWEFRRLVDIRGGGLQHAGVR